MFILTAACAMHARTTEFIFTCNDSINHHSREKIKKCMTDSIRANTYDPETRPGVSNLIDLYAIFADIDKEKAIAECASMKGTHISV